jgi:hypothetical protein
MVPAARSVAASIAASVAASVALLVGACTQAAGPAQTTSPRLAAGPAQATHPRLAFWRDIHAHDTPPAAAELPALVDELVGMLRSPDPEIRDQLAYDMFERWIGRDARLGPELLRRLIASLYDGLHAGIGSRGDDRVFGRSFSALVLSMVAARDVAAPFLGDDELTGMVTTAAWYADAEVDLRGYVDGPGWAHAAAHTADWLYRIAAHPSLGPARADTVLAAVLSLTVRRHGEILHYGEDGRLAQPVLELLHRSAIDGPGFSAWLARLAAPLSAPESATFDRALFAAQRNARNLILTLFVALSIEASPNAVQSAALAALHKTIAG